MIAQTLAQIYERDLNKLKEELSLYKNEGTIWEVKDGISNSAGNLALHLVGNLKHFIGAGLGKTDYIRNRDSEFTLKNIPRKDLLEDIDNTIGILKSAIGKLSDEDFSKDFPVEIQNKIQRTDYALFHLLSHLSYHLGQINYHRRLILD